MTVEESLSQYVEVYRTALEDEKETNWVRGEAAEAVSALHKLDKSRGILDTFLKETGETKVAFNQNRWVWNAFKEHEDLRNLPGLTWTHFRAAAGTPDPESWIKQAYDNGWTTKQLIDAIQEDKVDTAINSGIACYSCNKQVEKKESVTVSYKRKRMLFCCVKCAINWLSQDEKKEETS